MISIQQKGKDIKIIDDADRKKTTLTIVQEFPKKKTENSPSAGELLNITHKSDIQVPRDSYFLVQFNHLTNYLYKKLGFPEE